MTKKRRVFDIDFDEPLADVPAGTDTPEHRRGPMATAITENADALAERHRAEAAIREENDRLAFEYVELKKQGLIVDLIPVDRIHATKLIRDRVPKRDDEIDELKASIQAVGLSNPIRVEEVDGGWELVQGWRRLTAYRELWQETQDDAYARIPAGLLAKGAQLDELYTRMVDENLVRRDISFAEMAQLAVAYAADPETPVADAQEAADRLYSSASRQKRSYIRHFTKLMRALGPALLHAELIPRRLGLDLVKRIEETPDCIVEIVDALGDHPGRDADTELAILQGFAKAVPAGTKAPKTTPRSTAKTTFKLSRPEGVAKCTAADGRLELQLNRDFSSLDRRRLEEAVQALLDTLSD